MTGRWSGRRAPDDGAAPGGTPDVRGPVSAGPSREVRRAGDRALLVDCADGDDARALHAALVARPLPGQGELLPGARTVLVHLTPAAVADPAGADRLARVLAVLPLGAVLPGNGVLPVDEAGPGGASGRAEEVVLDTVYDGEDLEGVAALLGTTAAGVVAAHADRAWTASFVGFAPGFAYLEPDGPPLDVPRRSSPRTEVPAGSVALAGPYSAVYPRSSPGGWQLIGRTDAVLWDLAREQPALVRTGTRVRFRAVRELVVAPGRTDRGHGTAQQGAVAPPAPDVPAPDPPAPDPVGAAGLEVVAPGAFSLIEDLGRPGHLDLGVGRSGALDRRAAVAANRLVGNPRHAAVVEAVLGGLSLRARGRQVLAVTGAPAPLTIRTADGDERAHPRPGVPFALDDGEVLRLGEPPRGLRSYVAVRGGLAVDAVLGSRATDVLSGLGPAPLQAGDVLGVLPPPADAVAAWSDALAGADPAGADPVRVLPGPRADRLGAGGLDRLAAQTWTVSPRSNRVGLRLDGDPLDLAAAVELPSEGVVTGAVQVPPSGLPVIFLADHPVTGGYPVVAVVRDADLDRLAQLRPGARIQLVVADGA